MRRQRLEGRGHSPGTLGRQELDEAGGTFPGAAGGWGACGPADTAPVDFWSQSWENKCLFT